MLQFQLNIYVGLLIHTIQFKELTRLIDFLFLEKSITLK